jgi:hypothetical protein
MLPRKVTTTWTGMVRGAAVLSIVHPTLDTLEAAVIALNFAELGM